MDVAQEWLRLIGFLDYEEAVERLDLYMMQEDSRKPPMPRDFLRNKPSQKPEEWRAPVEHQWHLEFPGWDRHRKHGRVFDQEGREYVHDPVYEDGYHYDLNGRICAMDGRVVYQ